MLFKNYSVNLNFMTKKIIFTLIVLMAFSCQDSSTIRLTHKLDAPHRWFSKQEMNFDFSLETDASYSFTILVSHIYDYNFDEIPVEFILIKPNDNKPEKINVTLRLKDNNGKIVSDCLGDICDFKEVITTEMKLKKGNYKAIIKQKMSGFPYLPNIYSTGIMVEKIK